VNLYVALVHFPMQSRTGGVVATSLTSINVPDIARTACTYGAKRFYIVTPLESQQRIAHRLREFWLREEELINRKEAVSLVEICEDLDACYQDVVREEGQEPWVWGTSARTGLPFPRISWEEARAMLTARPVLILFGTGNGMAAELLAACDALLPPIRPGGYNWLSVRAAAAIILDRLKGDKP